LRGKNAGILREKLEFLVLDVVKLNWNE